MRAILGLAIVVGILGGSGCATVAFRNCRHLTTPMFWSGDMAIDDFSMWQLKACRHG